MVLIHWFECKETWVNICTGVAGIVTFVLANMGMLGLTQPEAFELTLGLMALNNFVLQPIMRYWSTDVVAASHEIAAGQLDAPK